MLKLAIIGCGALGSEVVKAVKNGILKYEVVALLDKKFDLALKLADILGNRSIAVRSIDELLSRNPDIVVEVAAPIAVKQYAEKILNANKIFVVMSSGGLLDNDLFERLIRIINEGKGKLIIPSGAVGGVDVVSALKLVEDAEVSLVTIKNAFSFKEEYLAKVGIKKEEIKTKTLLFSGPASEAIKYFPTMINVAATLSLALGRIVNVSIFADPEIETTVHIVEIKSKAVNAYIKLENKHHPDNPRTSYLAALSLIRTLQRLQEEVIVGT